MNEDWMNEDEIEVKPLTWWEWLHLGILGLITVLWIGVLVKIVGWIAWVVKGVIG